MGAFPATLVVVLVGLVAALGAGTPASRRGEPGTTRKLASLVIDVVLVGLLAARAGFVLVWWQRYADNPWSVFYIGDGGFLFWAGVPVAIVFALWRVRNMPALARPLGTALLTGGAVWVLAGAGLLLLQRTSTGLPEVTLTRLGGGTVELAQLSDEPMVVNLWATWCPPCRREMPMLAAAQRRFPEVTFVFVNQRQGPAVIRDYLHEERLRLNHVLLDVRGALARQIGTRALPTTLFYDANGRLVDVHVGMLTATSLAAALQTFDLFAAIN